ncbi:MAG: thioredoxin domain-containing protein [Methanothrix sp.]|uniref:thioredoxin domain-containing protein n=1 Tax=Methanothrix sp. TaxID=90426 RepID=UPI0025D9CDE4|nr:thioredoxin domain-containing protein [Methanothrix sp.]MBK7386840.1 thioredoxin domain-containing protein [Methanothrix sp.]
MSEDSRTGIDPLRSDSQPNRLYEEKSPYLLQHAYNPVDWYPWGEEAFEAAVREDKPIFLSVGYSTCHWCHVMAHESFEDPDVARLLNRSFICIKVDREERPDIDQIYMAAAIAVSGRGGWPLTVIMTPDKKPFFAATYIPKKGHLGLMGLMELIPHIKEMWDNDRESLLASAEIIVDHLRGRQRGKASKQGQGGGPAEDAFQGSLFDSSLLSRGYSALSSIYDPENGGFGTAPKFPTPHHILFLLRCWRRTGNALPLKMAKSTLQGMRMGGIYDHVGFGFHRYSTDAEWFVPHFEKMLYDQALLAMAYTEAYQATGEEEYARTVREILEYILRDMTSPLGGFYSAEDADSEGVEGKFYTWSAEELKESLGEEDFSLLIRLFDVHEGGNFEQGRNILRQRSGFADAAAALKIPDEELYRRAMEMRSRLFAARERRVHPLKDDKILTDWNGLMIAALARAAGALQDPDLALAASRGADFLLEVMQTADGRLMHRYREGADIPANLDDYAFLIWGLIELYEAVFDAKYLDAALRLNEVLEKHFWDGEEGGFFFTADDGEKLLLRKKEYYDGALPSGNSIALLNLLRLSHLTGLQSFEEMAARLVRSALPLISAQPLGYSMHLCALDYALGPVYDIALAGSLEDRGMKEMLAAIRGRFLPNKALLLASGSDISRLAPFARELVPVKGKAAAYVCLDHICQLPVTGAAELIDLLEKFENKT